jgi:hypothetical protein
MINSVLAGAFASILAAGVRSLMLIPVIAIGVSVLVVSIWLHVQIAARIWPRATREKMDTRFPTPED